MTGAAVVLTLVLAAWVVDLAMQRAEQKRKRREAVRPALRLLLSDLDEQGRR